jgi:hypothetical protein
MERKDILIDLLRVCRSKDGGEITTGPESLGKRKRSSSEIEGIRNQNPAIITSDELR